MRRVLDLALVIAVAPFLLLPGLVVALLVRLTSPGPVLYRAERVGRHGRPFRMLKFRSMREGAHTGSGITTREDDRITPLGQVLRRFRIDEWPQLVNILRGDMSFVGPRPETPRFVQLEDPVWQEVLGIRPGVTGPTQLDFADREQEWIGDVDPERDYLDRVQPAKLALDVAYVRNRTLVGDLVLLLRTALRAIGIRGA